MAHDVFISHSSKDKPAADAVCALLESDKLRCWIAPRDVQAGVSYAGAIIDAINECRAMVLIFSDAANASPQIEREIERAANRRIPILPFRIENVAPQHGLEYFLSTPHWLDAFTPPLETHIRELARQLHALLDPRPTDEAAGVAAAGAATAAAAAAKPAVVTPPVARKRTGLTTGAMAAIGAVVIGGALAVAGGAVWMGRQQPAKSPPSSSAVARPAVASSEMSSAASDQAPASSASSAAESSAAAAESAAAKAVSSQPSPGPMREQGRAAPHVPQAIGRPPPIVMRPPPFRPPPFRPHPFRPHPFRPPPRRPPPPFRRHPRFV